MQIVSYNHPEQTRGTNFQDFFHDELRKVLWSELMIQEITPFLIKQTLSEDLAKTLSLFFLDTEKELMQLEEVFSLLELPMEEKKCDIVKAIIDNVWLISSSARGKMRDAAILLTVQKIISMQTVSYRTLSMYLRRMKKTRAAYIVEGTLSELKKADNLFHNLSVYINYAAMFSESYKEEILLQEEF